MPNFQRGLLESDQSISECLKEAIAFQMSYTLRKLFAIILVHYEPSNVRNLWDTYFDPLSEDFRRDDEKMHVDKPNKSIECRTLESISYFLESMGKNLTDYDLPSFPIYDDYESDSCPMEIQDERSIDIPSIDLSTEKHLNHEQLHAFKKIIDRVKSGSGGVFFVDGPGGTGKTFLYRALLANVRSSQSIAIATATSGVAAHILPGGRTAHSRFKIPIEANDITYCSLNKKSGLGDLLREARLIIWDEATMAKRWAIETLDRSLQDIVGNKEPFGGKVIVFGGDYRHVLPVVPKGTIYQTINASLIKSVLWPMMEKFSLTKNMRSISDSEFSNFLLRIGNGEEPMNEEGNIKIPEEMVIPYDNEEESEQRLINAIFPSLFVNSTLVKYMRSRAILAPKNEHVDNLNAKLINQFPGIAKIYTSFDDAVDDTHHYYTEEFLNSLTSNGLPPHKLILKEHCPIMLLRNLDPSNG